MANFGLIGIKNRFGFDIQSYDKPTNITYHNNQRVYQEMPKEGGYYFVVHEYSNNKVGHVNLELIHNGKRVAWLGANQNGFDKFELGLKGKIFDETDKSIDRIKEFSNDHSMTIRSVTEREFNILLNRANYLFNTVNDYDITKNCLHFVNDVLSHGYTQYGKGNETLDSYVKANTLANFYAAITNMGIPFDNKNMTEFDYRHFIEQNRERLSSHKEFLDLKLNDVRKSLQVGHIEDIPSIWADGDIIMQGKGIFDFTQYKHLKGRNIYLYPDAGDNTYHITFGQNQKDIIYDKYGNDKLILNIDNHNKLWFSKENNDLRITNLENNGSVMILSWFKKRWRGGIRRRFQDDLSHRIEQISTSSGKTIYSAQVDKLVQAMSVFDPNSGGQINLTPQQQSEINNTIAANWV